MEFSQEEKKLSVAVVLAAATVIALIYCYWLLVQIEHVAKIIPELSQWISAN